MILQMPVPLSPNAFQIAAWQAAIASAVLGVVQLLLGTFRVIALLSRYSLQKGQSNKGAAASPRALQGEGRVLSSPLTSKACVQPNLAGS